MGGWGVSYRFMNGIDGETIPGLNEAEFRAMYTSNNKRPTYVFYDARNRVYWDGSCSNAVGAKINTKPRHQNARFDTVGNVIATRTINAEQEIYVSYGRSYGPL